MTLAEAGEIFGYWAENPPAHLMTQIIARLLGWKPAAQKTAPPLSDLAALAPPGLVVTARGDLGMPAPLFDIAALRERNRARLANRSH